MDKAEKVSIIEQPLEGLLYDLDLMPEQCKSTIANMRRTAVEELRKEIEQLRKEKEWLVELMYEKMCESPISLKDYKNTIIDMMQQALKEKE
ncbi:MAG TPA: hypothetical protein ENH82_02495 [bacterium]|nr:hypothetical protein [bacterium]